MRSRIKTVLLTSLFFSFLTFNLLEGQNVRMFTNANNITTDDNFVITVELNNASGQIPRPSFPEIQGFLRTGTSTQQSMGSAGYTVSFSQTYLPQKTGTFKIPKFKYSLGGNDHTYGPAKVTVTKGTGKRRSNNGTASGDPFGNFFKDPFDEFFRDPYGAGGTNPKDLEFQESNADYFMAFNLNKNKCFVGEQLVGEVVLYINQRDAGKINVDGLAISEMQQRIKNSGFWQEIYEFSQVPMKPVNIEGKRYYAYTLYRTYLFPLKAGKIDFDNLYLDAKKLFVATNASIRQRITGQNTKFEPIRIRAPKKSLMVRPLPSTNLDNPNMVGQFKMEGNISAQEVNTGDVLELSFKVQGNGNMAMAPEITTYFSKEFDVDEPSTNLKTVANQNRYSGEKTYTYYLVPTRNGSYDLGPIKFYYFDPKEEKYDSLVVETIPVKINGEDLENLVLKQSGNDEFYQTAIVKSANQLNRDQKGPWMAFLGGFILIAGVITFKVIRNKKDAKKDTPPPSIPKRKLD